MNESNGWHTLTITSAVHLPEILSSALFDLGAAGTEENPNALTAYFPDALDIEHIQLEIQRKLESFESELGLTGPFRLESGYIEQENWQENWKQHFQPIEIDSRLMITPSWEKAKVPNDRIVITIDPQQAFGTGGHETTHLMLQAVLRTIRPNMRILDVGAGSGILAIAAARLGASQIVAFDNDPVAIETAVQNADLNEVKKTIRFYVGDKPAFRSRFLGFDLILANILTNELIPLIPDLVTALSFGDSYLILSGFLVEEEDKIGSILSQNGLVIVEQKARGEWMSFFCQKVVGRA